MIVGVLAETCPGEHRVSLIPINIAQLKKRGLDFLVEVGAGEASGFADADYQAVGAELVGQRSDIFARADILTQVQSFGCNKINAEDDLTHLRKGQLLLGMMDPLGAPQNTRVLARKNITAMALELVPRISRAQSMDVLSSMATIGGYKAVLIAAANLARIFPLMMTAAGTLQAARVFIMGAGVAGLQACATAKRLGAIVEAYDVRPAAREQILSVGAKPIELDLKTDESEGKGGYAKVQGEEFIKQQQELMAEVLAQQDVVITTAAVPGAKSPILVTEEMVKRMKTGAVIVDLAAERGGNCELTRLGETRIEHGVTIIGPDNLSATVAQHSSQMFGKNLENLLMHLVSDEGELTLDFEDEIIAETVVVHGGDVVHPRMRGLLGLDDEQAVANPGGT